MKVWVADHTVCLDLGGRCYLFRPCKSWDGKFSINGIQIPWFKVKELYSKSGKSIWRMFAIPYLCFGKVTLAKDVTNR